MLFSFVPCTFGKYAYTDARLTSDFNKKVCAFLPMLQFVAVGRILLTRGALSVFQFWCALFNVKMYNDMVKRCSGLQETADYDLLQ